jgi:hypothetical protein
MKKPDILAALEPVAKAFDELGVQYYVGGSVASSAYGIARATLDVDIVSDLKLPHVSPMVEMLKASYYIDKDMILEAIDSRSSFNVIHLDTMIKVDVFVVGDTPYDRETLKRKRKDTLDDEQGTEFYLGSAEDVILNKLKWFRMGGNVSEQQWRDVLGVLKVQERLLDTEYLRHWAAALGLTGLLEEAFRDAGL